MSVVPFTTQIGRQASASTTQNSQEIIKIVLVYSDKITDRQASLMTECQNILSQNLAVLVRQADDISTLSKKLRFFVIASLREDLIKKIRSHHEKPIIYLPRAVIEARSYQQVNLPVRNLAISLTMHKCRVFLVKTCDIPSVRSKINEMCGTVVANFNDNNPNVVITDRADNKYCIKAFKRSIPVVSRDWVDENYNIATEECNSYFNHDAMTTVKEHQIKPFHGLYFKIIVKNSSAYIKKLITENQGHVIYGNENCLTHIVRPPCVENATSFAIGGSSQGSKGPRVVDIDFLKACVESGYHITKREYRDIKEPRLQIKQEKQSQPPKCMEENYTPPPLGSNLSPSDFSMPPPASLRPLKEPDRMNDMILKALSTFETPQTQIASTQMRRLPEPELRIEQTFEPSQQLYWNDTASKRG